MVNYRHGLLPSTEALLVMNACWCAGSKGHRRGWVLCKFRFVIATVGSFGLWAAVVGRALSFINQLRTQHQTASRSQKITVQLTCSLKGKDTPIAVDCGYISSVDRKLFANHQLATSQPCAKHLPSIHRALSSHEPRACQGFTEPFTHHVFVALRWQGGSHSLHKEKAEEAHEAIERLISWFQQGYPCNWLSNELVVMETHG